MIFILKSKYKFDLKGGIHGHYESVLGHKKFGDP